MTEGQIDAELKILYAQWIKEIKTVAPEFFEDEYSNPYFTCVPRGWCEPINPESIDNCARILIVGEEGYGEWGRGKADGVNPNILDGYGLGLSSVQFDYIQKIQEYCWCSLASYLNYDLHHSFYHVEKKFDYIHSPFGNRARQLSKFGVCTWTNQDTIHIRSELSCKLSDYERDRLHSVNTKLLSEEIRILNPTHVVLFGWYGMSIKAELPKLYDQLYPNGPDDNSVWKNKAVAKQIDGIHYVCGYHPNWGYRHKGYEDALMMTFLSTFD